MEEKIAKEKKTIPSCYNVWLRYNPDENGKNGSRDFKHPAHYGIMQYEMILPIAQFFFALDASLLLHSDELYHISCRDFIGMKQQ